MLKKFQRVKEDFICKNCHLKVRGNGYTNHCPNCLWSRHEDENPGDRQAGCGGMMKPIGESLKERGYIITHKCLKCGAEKKNKTSPDDKLENLTGQ